MTWVAHDIRDGVVDFIAHWSGCTELAAGRFAAWLGLSPRKFSRWRQRYGKANEHNALVPRDHWLEAWEKQVIQAFFCVGTGSVGTAARGQSVNFAEFVRPAD